MNNNKDNPNMFCELLFSKLSVYFHTFFKKSDLKKYGQLKIGTTQEELCAGTAKFTGKHQCQSLFFNKVVTFKVACVVKIKLLFYGLILL